MANLNVFKQKIGGGIRPNQFEVVVATAPDSVSADLFDKFSFLCHSSSLPGSNIGQAPVFHRGRMIPLAGERSFEPWTVTVYADQNMKIRKAFEKWSNIINDYGNNSGQTSPDQYRGRLEVHLLDRNGATTHHAYSINGVFPINISEMQLSWQANDVVGEFSVTFAVENISPMAAGSVDTRITTDDPADLAI